VRRARVRHRRGATWEAELAGAAPEIHLAAPAVADHEDTTAIATRTWAIGAAAVGAVDRRGWDVGGFGELALGSTESRWTARAAALVTTRKRAALGPGAVAWARQALCLGARYEVGACQGASGCSNYPGTTCQSDGTCGCGAAACTPPQQPLQCANVHDCANYPGTICGQQYLCVCQ
jgi:hypothetical protein